MTYLRPWLALLVVLLLTGTVVAADSLAGRWVGTYTNSIGEAGNDSMVLTEDAEGTISGTWASMQVSGRRQNSNSMEIQAATAKRSYLATATVRNNVMTIRYIVTRLDSRGTYEGKSILRRR